MKEIQTSNIFAALDAIISSGMKAMKLMRFLANADKSIQQSIMEDVCKMEGWSNQIPGSLYYWW